jgi:hypothetical protein
MNRRRYLSALAIALAAGGWAKNAFSMSETTPEVQLANAETPRQDPILGVGYHPGNFIGPVAFDVILRPLPHVALDLQVGTMSLENDMHGLAVAPELQWELRSGWRSTPYAGLGFRYEEDWSDGVKATGKGGLLVGGWQFRWQSGFAVLVGGGVLSRTPVTLNTPVASYWSSGGWSGTNEVGCDIFSSGGLS